MTDATSSFSSSNFSTTLLDNSTTALIEMADSGWKVLASTSVQAFSSAINVLEESYPLCKKTLDHNTLFPERDPDDTRVWCEATYDTVLCWPPTPANSSVTLQCPHMKGLDPNKFIEKRCDETGRWAGKSPGHYENAWGWTNFTVCFKIDYEDVKNITKDCHVSGVWSGRSAEEMGPSLPGWTNFTMCYTDEVIYIMQNLNNESLTIAQEVARNARKLEFVGLGLSLVSLILAISIFSYFRRLRVFRNLLHLHLMIAMLMVVIIRLVLYIDLIFTGDIGVHTNSAEGKTINTMPIVCEGMFFFLEYFKTVTFCWMFIEGVYLNQQIVFGFFDSEPKLHRYFIAGYGIPLIHTLVWLLFVLIKKDFKVERCLGSYYLEPEFWILDGPRMAELVINLFFICNVIRVLYSKVRESNNTSEAGLKKSVKAAMMLLPLLGVPNIMQTIPFAPTRDNIMVFAVWTYTASFTYMYQGLMVASIYCFTNKEVNHVLKAFYARYRLLHKSQNELRRGSRSVASHYAAKNGTANGGAVTQTNNVDESGKLSPFPSRSKKGSDDSTTKLMKDVVVEEKENNNGYGSAGEMTPLRREGSTHSSTKSP